MQEKNSKKSGNVWREPLIVFGKISGWVATPVIGSLFIGKFLDQKFGTTPIIFLSLTGLAFLISCFGIYKESVKYLKDIENNHGTQGTDNN
jgi:F0F1-type ATP synthase assembly protein I